MKGRKSVLIFGAVLAAVVTFSLIAHAAIITAGLAGRWIFNEASGITASDSSGFGDNGMLQGAALFTLDPTRGQALSVSGVSGQVGIPYASRLEPFSGTISVWVKPTMATTGDIVQHPTNVLIRCNSQFSGYAYGVRVYSTGQAMFQIANDDPRTCAKSPQIVVSASGVALNKWTHLVGRWDGVGTLTLFVNGKAAGKGTYSPNPTKGLSYGGNGPVSVASGLGSNLEFIGSVSDLRIYSRALSDTEISNIYSLQQ